MSATLKALDVWPIVAKLSRRERQRLLAMVLAGDEQPVESAASPYARLPVNPAEFTADDDGLGWDASGWEEFDAARCSARGSGVF